MLNGLRVSEVCAANVGDLRREPDGGYSLVVRGKGRQGGRRRAQPAHPPCRLRRRRRTRPGPLVSPPRRPPPTRWRPHPPRPYNRQAVARLLTDQAGLIGDGDDQVAGVHSHKLRHTFITLLLDRDVPLPAVQDAARRASSDTTRLDDRTRAAWREHPTHHLNF